MKLLFSLFLFVSCSVIAQNSVNNIIPKPVSVETMKGESLTIDNKTVIAYHKIFEKQAIYLKEQIRNQCGLDLSLVTMDNLQGNGSLIILYFDTSWANRPEMYTLRVTLTDATVYGRDEKGIVNGIQTLLQLLPIRKTEKISFSQWIVIKDYPRFSYRGMHLDVARHFFPVEYIKKYIDYLTFHKFNTFHWHLTDDQGWRIEMLSYKKLNEIGSWRNATLIGHFKDQPARYDSTRYGGFYTRSEIKDIIDYASVRGITVIPEIDIPGHARAIIASYPELSTRPDTTWTVATTWGMYNRQNNVLAPKPETFEFLKTVFQEIADLFPSPYIHVGGDECSKIWWKADPATQAFMKQNNIRNESELQTYFIEKVAGFLAEKGKKIIGWHEIIEGGVDPSALIMNWADEKKTLEAAHKGYSIITAPGKPLYFDHYQSKDPRDSLAIHGYNPLEAVYQYDPVPKELQKLKLAHRVVGGQANVWTEYMAYPTKVDYMIFPRMTALSEVLWTPPAQKNYADFLRRLKTQMILRYQFWSKY